MSDFESKGVSDDPDKRGGNIQWVGIILILVGLAFLGRNLVPAWVFRWEMILFTIGLLIGIRQQFNGTGWFVMMAIGGVSMLDMIFPVFNKSQFTWATVAIVIGLYLIIRPGTKPVHRRRHEADRSSGFDSRDSYQSPAGFQAEGENTYSEVIDAVSVFSGIKKVVTSKDFRGGEIVSVLGGAEIDLSKADIKGRVRLEATNILGGTELIIPPNWHVKSEVVAILGGVEDKRDPHFLRGEPDKILFLEGVCILGGIEIKSY
jgi:predicted membrane protein